MIKNEQHIYNKYDIILSSSLIPNFKKININKEKSKIPEKGEKDIDYFITNNKKIERAYDYFNYVDSTFPNYLRKNLQEMPNNKGYIFKSIFYFGLLPAEKGKPTVMFEKNKDILKIHEWTTTEYKIFEKRDQDRRILISKIPIKCNF